MPSKCTPKCGDSILLGNQCDDGNVKSEDGCSDTCKIEKGWICSGAPSNCKTTCGDGYIVHGKEECDDFNSISNDGCSNKCLIEKDGPQYKANTTIQSI